MRNQAILGTLALALGFAPSVLPDAPQDGALEIVPVAGLVSMLVGPGGNIGVSAGPDGLLMIDDKFAQTEPAIRAALAKLGPGKLELLLNTHYHGDHTGSNAAFGDDALILAHDKVRLRLLNPARGQPTAAAGLPVVTYADSISIHFNGEEIKVLHMPAAHTDGDSVVFFTGTNVVHMGDNFFADRFPYIDLDGGGSVDGFLAAAEKVLARIDGSTKVIPGHGPLSSKAGLEKSARMIRETRAAVQRAVQAGKSLAEIQSVGVAEEWKGWAWQFIDEKRWIEILHRSLTAG